MKPFTMHTGLTAALNRANVDTDQIIPKQFLKRVERTGFGTAAFFDWRYRPDGSLDPSFELNAPRVVGASILLAGANFGCGSSREHAPWALAEYGFRSIIAESFADIFYGNALQNGLLPVRLAPGELADLFRREAAAPHGYQLTVDLEHREVRDGQGFRASFEIDDYRREGLLQGLDAIGRTLQHQPAIAAFEDRRAALLARLEA
jgi:3-isopropylmalate/(R)-2-methylmalate dehydratase small subunit